jgi:hypothetical protein
VRVFLVNLYTEELGNPAMPEKFKKFTEQTQPPLYLRRWLMPKRSEFRGAQLLLGYC